MWLNPWRKQGKSSASFQKSKVETKGCFSRPGVLAGSLSYSRAMPHRLACWDHRLATDCHELRAGSRCAVQAIAETIGQLPVQVYQRGERNGRERAIPRSPRSIRSYTTPRTIGPPPATFIEQITRDAGLLERFGRLRFCQSHRREAD